jgi:hypothetical protein
MTPGGTHVPSRRNPHAVVENVLRHVSRLANAPFAGKVSAIAEK